MTSNDHPHMNARTEYDPAVPDDFLRTSSDTASPEKLKSEVDVLIGEEPI